MALLFCLSIASVLNVQAADTTNPQLSLGTGFYTLIETGNGVMFQHTNKTGGVYAFLAAETIAGTWDGYDCHLSTNRRGGSFNFISNQTATIQFYASQYDMHLIADGATLTKITATSWVLELTEDTDLVQLNWGFPLVLPHEENFMFYIGMFGIGLLVAGIMLTAYAFRHYTLFTLSDKETLWDKDILPFCIVLDIGGVCLIAAWLLGA